MNLPPNILGKPGLGDWGDDDDEAQPGAAGAAGEPPRAVEPLSGAVYTVFCVKKHEWNMLSGV